MTAVIVLLILTSVGLVAIVAALGGGRVEGPTSLDVLDEAETRAGEGPW